MNACHPSNQEALSQRCRLHPLYYCELIHLQKTSNQKRVCMKCIKENRIDMNETLLIRDLLEASPEECNLDSYPPLKDLNFQEKIKQLEGSKEIEQIMDFFNLFISEVIETILATRDKIKSIAIKKKLSSIEVKNLYKGMAKLDELQAIIRSNNESELNEFIQNILDKIDENTETLKNAINQSLTQFPLKLNCEQELISKSLIFKDIQNMIFYYPKTSIPEDVYMIKSTFEQNESQVSKNLNDGSLEFTNNLSSSDCQAFLNFIFDPSKLYVIHLEFQRYPVNASNYFLVGIVDDETKDLNFGFHQRMAFYRKSNCFGISKKLKGVQQDELEFKEKEKFEMRVHLNQKYLKIATLPGYDNVWELDSSDRINLDRKYRLYLNIHHKHDILRVTGVQNVSKFDDNM